MKIYPNKFFPVRKWFHILYDFFDSRFHPLPETVRFLPFGDEPHPVCLNHTLSILVMCKGSIFLPNTKVDIR